MSVTISKTNKPLNPRAKDLSPKGYNRASLYSGKALDFDGVNDQVNVTTSDVDFGANDFTVTAIANWTGSNADGKLAYAERGTSPSALAAWQIRTDGAGNMKFQTNTASGGWTEVSFSGVEAILNKGLTHLTFVRVGSSVTLYINGALYSSGSGIASTLDPANGNFCIGNRIGSANYWNGLIGQYKIFNTALTAGQVSDLYNNPEKIVPDGVANSALKLWLPMMEGAGTTVYDGSGNGNHGTINGATWISGVGAPVAQTALVGWNKGTNLLTYSNYFINANWIKDNGATVTAGQSGYDGSTNAWKLEAPTAGSNRDIYQIYVASAPLTFSLYAKAGTTDWIRINLSGIGNQYFNLANGTAGSGSGIPYSITPAGNGYYRISISGLTGSITSVYIFLAAGDLDINVSAGDNVYIQNAQLTATSDVQPYVETLATAQTSPVLLPQGLTANKDIFGNSVSRNAYALNLDGASWAEVHDNASLDMTTAMTMECWAQIDDADGFQVPLAKFDFAGNQREYLIYYDHTNKRVQFSFGHGSSYQSAYFNITATGQWFHLAATTTGSIITPYVNGVAGSTAVQTTALAASTIPLTIGSNGVYTDKLPNQIALPRIYNRALTATEVARNYNADKSKFGL